MKFEQSDYKYIFIIIVLLLFVYFAVLPFTFQVYNGNADRTDCIADVNTIVCDDQQKICQYNCTTLDNKIIKINFKQP